MESVAEGLKDVFANAGFRCVIVDIGRLFEIKHEFHRNINSGMLNQPFYDEIVTRYELNWDFQPPTVGPDIRSIILVASPLPKVRVLFKLNGKSLSTIIPSTYLHDTDDVCRDIVSQHLYHYQYRIYETILPEKLLAVRSGLAEYGRNNIAYIAEWGSYFRLKSFFTDMPCATDDWREVSIMARCESCLSCQKMCPTGAIPKDRFLIRAERCLTFHNEGPKAFPEWIDPSWHHCLFGCIRCQDGCPMNRDFTDWVVDGVTFSEDETRMILEGVAKDGLPVDTLKKLKRMYLIHDYGLLRRNLNVLMKNQ